MRPLGNILMLTGALVGATVAVGIAGGFHLTLPWLVSVAVAKLALVACGGLMATGAVFHRLAIRQAERDRLLPPPESK